MSQTAASGADPPAEEGFARSWTAAIEHRWTGPLLVGSLGMFVLLVSVINFLSEFSTLGPSLPSLFAGALAVLPALGLIAIARHLHRDEYTTPQRLTVAGACFAGAVLLSILVFLTVLVRLAEGRVVAEPQFPLVVAGAVGGIAGSLVGMLYVRVRESATQAERARERLAFVNSVLRHDVLNGIAVITARAELLHDETGEDENVAAILGQGEQLSALVERTRSIIRALDEDDAIAREPVAMAPVLETQVDRLLQSYPGVAVDLDVPEDLVVRANDSLADVVWNVLTNAVDHHDKPEPSINVTAETLDGSARLRIADDGPGITDADRERVLEGLGDLNDSGGFGLFFVRTMVEAWGGRLQLEDNQPRGTVVVIELQVADEPVHVAG